MAGKKRKKRSVTRQLTLSSRSLRSRLTEELADHGVHAGQDDVLLAINAEDGIALGELARHLAVRPPTVTKTIARLAQQGLVEKRVQPGTQSRAFLTEKGETLVAAMGAIQKRIEKRALAGLSRKDTKKLRKLLEKIEANLSSASEEPIGSGGEASSA